MNKFEEFKNFCLDQMKNQHFDSLAVAVLDFNLFKYESFEFLHNKQVTTESYFDLASLSKPLTLAAAYLNDPTIFTNEMNLLLEHRAGLPSGGRLSKVDWKETIMAYKISNSTTNYSDYSALRLQLDIEKKYGRPLKDIVCDYWDRQMCFWKDLPAGSICPVTGERHWIDIQGVVHDENAYRIGQFTAHAGLFATISGLARSILNMDKKYNLLDFMIRKIPAKKDRFCLGWDTVTTDSGKESLAGQGCGPLTFGHLGFTGTSIWIDPQRKKGHIILTNATKNYWYDREGLNLLRKKIGTHIWI